MAAVDTDSLRRHLDIFAHIVPMSDDPVHTRVCTELGWLDFQDYFVRLRCEPVVREITFAGAQDARPAEGILQALGSPNLRAVMICPSNPMLNIEHRADLGGAQYSQSNHCS